MCNCRTAPSSPLFSSSPPSLAHGLCAPQFPSSSPPLHTDPPVPLPAHGPSSSPPLHTDPPVPLPCTLTLQFPSLHTDPPVPLPCALTLCTAGHAAAAQRGAAVRRAAMPGCAARAARRGVDGRLRVGCAQLLDCS
eukprot:350288-Chlamydomonas_euryale.AAC.11